MDQVIASFHTECVVDEAFLRRLWVYTCATHDEVSALGEVEVRGPQLYIPDKFHLLPQERSPGHVEFDIDEVARFITRYVQSGQSPERVRLWFHTHVNMDVFFSFTDEETIKRLAKMMPLVVAVVTNQRGEALWRIVQSGTYTAEWLTSLPGDRPRGDELTGPRKEIDAVTRQPVWLKKWGFHQGHQSGDYDVDGFKVRDEKISVTLIVDGKSKRLKLQRLAPIEGVIEAFHLDDHVITVSGMLLSKDRKYPLIHGDVIKATKPNDKEPDREELPTTTHGPYDFV